MRTRRIFVACFLCWVVMICAAVVAHHWLALIGLLCLPAILGVIAALVVTVHTRATRRRGDDDQGDVGDAPLQVPYRPAVAPPRRRARPFRADQPAGPPAISGPDAGAVARGEQEVMRQRAAAGEATPDLAAFRALMLGAGAGDLEDVGAPDDDQPGGPL